MTWSSRNSSQQENFHRAHSQGTNTQASKTTNKRFDDRRRCCINLIFRDDAKTLELCDQSVWCFWEMLYIIA